MKGFGTNIGQRNSAIPHDKSEATNPGIIPPIRATTITAG